MKSHEYMRRRNYSKFHLIGMMKVAIVSRPFMKTEESMEIGLVRWKMRTYKKSE